LTPVFWKWVAPTADTERQLIAAARRNDRAAFDTLVQSHQERLRAFLVRRVGADAAEDVLQETFLAAWQAIPRLDLRVRFKTWLFSIAVHKAADHHRSQGRLARQEVTWDTSNLPTVGDSLDAVERRVFVQRVLASLNDDQRQILEMYYFAELTLPEIATILGRNLNTLKYQFYRIHAVTAETFAGQETASMASLSKDAQTETSMTARTEPCTLSRKGLGLAR
jgi:RNA polymerase sigma-70 factor (ECF subfamily)